ncbi:molybdenum cofactor biosynthesis protein MoaE [Coprothermobacteraceae bacterium]|nr:molybdenum cofactor biosynthesis protein MoaE [Coprothermobacteraceae bacterium]
MPIEVCTECGALVTFHGVVRSKSKNGVVVAIEYSAYRELAYKQMYRIWSEVQEKYGVRLYLAHRVGKLNVGETAMLVAATSEHREEAFSAVMETIDRVKKEVPIWKKEILEDGRSVWI